MNRRFLLVLFCLSIGHQLGFAQTYVSGSLQQDESLRTYRIFLPASYEPGQSLPLVINLHGLGSTDVEQILYSRMDAVADSVGFIVVYPQGIELSLNGQTSTHWNAGFGTGIDDLGFLSKLIDRLYTDYQIDLSRVYSTGMSNGGFMSYHLACQLSDRIAAIASVTGAITVLDIANCALERPMPIMQIHGTADPTVPFGGTAPFTPSIPDVVNFWVGHNQCDITPDTLVLPDVDQSDSTTAIRVRYAACDSSVEVHFYIIDGGGHSWPGAEPIPGLNPTNQDFSASEVIWEFFSHYVHPNPAVGTLLSSDPVLDITAFLHPIPNPVADLLRIEVKDRLVNHIRITDLQGRILWQQKQMSPRTRWDIHADSWPGAIYFLHIETEHGHIVQKLIRKN
ncbi:MAG: PHB depolymerase family esterase [Bacteroidota bacterium]